jgi:hypothetical protein
MLHVYTEPQTAYTTPISGRSTVSNALAEAFAAAIYWGIG